MRFDIITIFPAFFAGMFEHGVVKRAIQGGLLNVTVHDLRTFTHDRHRTVDDRPFGGGEGMVLKPEPLAEAVEYLQLHSMRERDAHGETVILLSAQGKRFAQAKARELAQAQRVVLLCGRYEGVDERVLELIADQELSIGDYVLSGGELAAAVVLDATMRLVPGVLGNDASTEYESFGRSDDWLSRQAGVHPASNHGSGGLLDYPHYTRPAEFLGLAVPEVLSSGNHEQIRRWRRQQALQKTLRNRPDLLEHAELSAEDRAFLDALDQAQSKDSV
ncbi:MAG: tRNA (guanosine(37)-N1)-methyltransferase TrmD [Acidobacteriaceae bacterium]